jgi:hypothetical protein
MSYLGLSVLYGTSTYCTCFSEQLPPPPPFVLFIFVACREFESTGTRCETPALVRHVDTASLRRSKTCNTSAYGLKACSNRTLREGF